MLAAGLIAAALSTRQPAVLAVLAAGAALLVLRSPGPRVAPVVGAFGIAISFALINPFVAVEGDTVIFSGPHVPGGLIDLEVTAEEVVYGALSGLRLAIAILACAFLVLRRGSRPPDRAREPGRPTLGPARRPRGAPRANDAPGRRGAVGRRARTRARPAGGTAQGSCRRCPRRSSPPARERLERGSRRQRR